MPNCKLFNNKKCQTVNYLIIKTPRGTYLIPPRGAI